jgi:hypothetical protein
MIKTNTRQTAALTILLTILTATACSAPPRAPDLGGIYSKLAQNENPYRNPVILIPGILGSRLVDRPSDVIVWGTFGLGNANPNNAEGARLVALPMTRGKKFSELHDNVIPTETLDKVVISFGGYPLVLNTYAYILGVLGVGGYRDQQQAVQDVVDWGDLHFYFPIIAILPMIRRLPIIFCISCWRAQETANNRTSRNFYNSLDLWGII